MMLAKLSWIALLGLACVAPEGSSSPPATTDVDAGADEGALPDPEVSIVARLRAEADALGELVSSQLARDFLDATARLPEGRGQTLYLSSDERRWLRPEDLNELAPGARAKLTEREWAASTYYLTKYGTPLAYTRAIELLGENGVESLEGERVLDYGYGGIGQLRLLAELGAHVVGVDPDPLLKALYGADGDTGFVPREDAKPGRVQLVEGRWPSSGSIRDEVGKGFGLFLSKNTLKRGYVHPEREADPAKLLHTGVDDKAFVQQLARVVESGGHVLIYNLCPPQSADDEPYIPWADGRFPFERELLDDDFKVLAFDKDDTPAALKQAAALGWDRAEGSLFATYTLLERR